MKLSDQGNAQRLIDHCGHTYKYVALQDKWVKWSGGTWETDHKGEIIQRAKELSELIREDARELLRRAQEESDEHSAKYLNKQAQTAFDWARQSEQSASIHNAVKLAETEQPVLPDEFDRDPYLLNCPNGVLDLRDRIIRPPSAEMLLTKSVKVAYNPKAHSELWCNFLHTLTGGDVELQHYLQRCFGYALLGEWREKSFWFAYGAPDGGKTTLLDTMKHVLGSYAIAADSTTWMTQQVGGNRDDIVRLLGARLVVSSEVKPGMQFDPKVMKQITGGDQIVASAKYQSPIAFYPQFALWLAGNERPRVPDTDDGMWRRLVCVPFNHSVPKAKQVKNMTAQLCNETNAPAVLAWLVDGYTAYAEADGCGTCDAVDKATAEYKRTMNPLLSFIEDCLIFTGAESDTIRGTDLQSCYQAWCKLNQIRQPVGPRTITHSITEFGGVKDRDARGTKWSGLRFTLEAKELHWS